MKLKRKELFRIIESFLNEQEEEADPAGEEPEEEAEEPEEEAEESEEEPEESEEEPEEESEEEPEESFDPLIVSFKLINKAGDTKETINIELDSSNNFSVDIIGKKEVLNIPVDKISDKTDDAISFIYSSIVQLQNNPGEIQKLLKIIDRIPFFESEIVKNEEEIDISSTVNNLMNKLNTRVYNVNLNNLVSRISKM